jgi:predicted extracellular nuclease
MVDPVRDAPPRVDDFRARGLVEILALDDARLLTLERAYTQGVGNVIEIFLVSFDGATDVRQQKSLARKDYRPVTKTRLLPLETMGLELDNVEGMTFGPRLADGRRSLVLVADDNFNPRQRNQILAFALDERELTPSLVQGSSHRSPFEGSWVRHVRGTVTSPAARGRGFWMQGPDDQDESTSDALLVIPAGEETASPGNVVCVDGLVRETGFPGGLTVTSLNRAAFEVVERAAPLPAAMAIGGGTGGRPLPPNPVDNDSLQSFEPAEDTIDFFESLEGMRVAVSDAMVVGPTTRFGEFAVLAGEMSAGARILSPAGGLVVTDEEVATHPFLVVTRPGMDAPQVAVGDRFEGSITGVLDYAFGSFRILAEEIPVTTSRSKTEARATLAASEDALLIASYNVENLSARSGEEKFRRVGNSISQTLASPDIIALQEIQDDTGPEDDGTVSADKTLSLLKQAILAAGGAKYEHLAVDPEDLADGGRPGANIRVAYLYRPDRVRFIPRGRPGARTAAEWLRDERGPFLSPNPGRVNPEHPAFTADPARDMSGVRKPLAAEFEFNGRRVFLINVHLRSKRGDSPLFGSVQPPVRSTEELRSGETRVISEFLDDLLGFDPEAAAIVLGDFNEHPYREPVADLATSGLHNLIEGVPENQRYTFIFRGRSQILDNVLVTESLAGSASTAIEILHVNSDFPVGLRAADHDPILARFQLP